MDGGDGRPKLPSAFSYNLKVFGGIAIIIGWQTRWIALGLAGFSILSALIFLNNFADQNEMASFMKNIAIAGGFLFLFANGAGAWSLDEKKDASVEKQPQV